MVLQNGLQNVSLVKRYVNFFATSLSQGSVLLKESLCVSQQNALPNNLLVQGSYLNRRASIEPIIGHL